MANTGDGSRHVGDKTHNTKELWTVIQNLEQKCDKRLDEMLRDIHQALQNLCDNSLSYNPILGKKEKKQYQLNQQKLLHRTHKPIILR